MVVSLVMGVSGCLCMHMLYRLVIEICTCMVCCLDSWRLAVLCLLIVICLSNHVLVMSCPGFD
ncbi:hypothetical protein BZA77DRAFT_324903 [Pyronema omphalodes]|nr:hypothetical protein BZA77DRAFT_324903 [Pyronema omphalodes]